MFVRNLFLKKGQELAIRVNGPLGYNPVQVTNIKFEQHSSLLDKHRKDTKTYYAIRPSELFYKTFYMRNEYRAIISSSGFHFQNWVSTLSLLAPSVNIRLG